MTQALAYVVDASVAIKWYLPEEDQDLARQVRRHAVEGHLRLVAPELIVTEVANVAWKRCRRGELLPEEAHSIAREILRAPVTLMEASPLLVPAAIIATSFNCTVYDALYLALAEAYDAVVVTADRRLGEGLPEDWRAERIQMLQELTL